LKRNPRCLSRHRGFFIFRPRVSVFTVRRTALPPVRRVWSWRWEPRRPRPGPPPGPASPAAGRRRAPAPRASRGVVPARLREGRHRLPGGPGAHGARWKAVEAGPCMPVPRGAARPPQTARASRPPGLPAYLTPPG
jgi:hypothetical protein